MDYSYTFVVLMGMGTVFFGLICIILLTSLMGVFMKGTAEKEAAKPAAPTAAPAPQQGMAPEIVAVITAVLSEEIGIPANSMNIVNIKKI